jgi:hypothetical protein
MVDGCELVFICAEWGWRATILRAIFRAMGREGFFAAGYTNDR